MSFLETYREKHQHPANRLLHSFGIPIIVISIPVVFWNWQWALGLFVFGWILQFIGHAIEGNSPAFFSNPVHLIVGPIFIIRKYLGLEPKKKSQD